MFRLLPLAMVVVVGCGADAPPKGSGDKPPADAKAKGEGAPPTLPEELLVAAFILENANDPKSVEFAKWGPHDLKASVGLTWAYTMTYLGLETDPAEVGAALQRIVALRPKLDQLKPLPVVRVRYRAKNKAGAIELYDRLYAVEGAAVSLLGRNVSGSDDWAAIEKQRIDAEKPKAP